MNSALLVTDSLALQGIRVGAEAGAFLEHQRGRAGEQLTGEVDNLLAGGCHGHRGDHTVELVGLQTRNRAVEIALDPFALDLQLGADCIAQIDIEAYQAAIGRFGFKRRVGRIDTKTQFLVFLGRCQACSHAQRQRREGQQCFFHYYSTPENH
ncbi:hypothetical protein D3C80_1625700 [compost metagenome]